jgi:hypothetical protein
MRRKMKRMRMLRNYRTKKVQSVLMGRFIPLQAAMKRMNKAIQ